MRDRGPRHDDSILQRTQRTIAVVRASFAVAAISAALLVLLNGQHNQDEYQVPGVAVTVRLWQALAVALLFFVAVLLGAIAEFARAGRHQFDP